MKWRVFAAIALTASVARVHAQGPPDAPPARGAGSRGSISGVVTHAPSGEPLAGASVKLLNEPPAGAPPGTRTQFVTTGVDGSFRFDDVPAGPWWIVANLQGFLPAEYGQRSPTGTGTPVDVAAGRRVNVRIAAWPTSGISGRVVDADGDPVGRAQVAALRVIYRDGKAATTIAQTVMTNDRGEYRMFWLTPGSYRVAAHAWDQSLAIPGVNVAPPQRFATMEQATAPVVLRRTLPGGVLVEETDVPVYAPSTTDPQSAATIALAPGDSAGEVDIQLAGNRVPTHHVRGVASRNLGLLSDRLLVVPRVQTPLVTIAAGVLQADGSFDISGVAPGAYMLVRQDGLGALPIEVGDEDVNVVLQDLTFTQLTGHVTFDRGSSARTATPSPASVMIQMTRDPDLIGMPGGGPRINPPPAEDGTLNFNGIPPGDYRLAILPFDRGYDTLVEQIVLRQRTPGEFGNAYVKSIRLGDADVLADGLHLWSPSQPSLEIVIGLNGAEVDGKAVDNGSRPAAGMIVVAVPDGANRGRADLYRETTTDREGHFAFAGLPPDEYTFYAFDDIERGAWRNQEFMRPFERFGRRVHLREGKNDALELSVVSGR